jgi:hypothetical protein
MKRSSVLLCLGILTASCALSFIVGRSLDARGVCNRCSKHRAPACKPPLPQPQAIAAAQQPASAAELAGTVHLAPNADVDVRPAEDDQARSPDTDRLLNAAFNLPLSDPRRSHTIIDLLAQLAHHDPLSALAWSEQLTSLRESHHARSQILTQWARRDPQSALNWAATALADVPTNLRNSQIQAIVRGFAQTDPVSAFQYAAAMDERSQSAKRLKQRLLGEVIETQIRGGGLQGAQITIAQMIEGPSKQSLQRELVSEWAAFDPQSAAAYVSALGDSATSDLKTSLIGEWAKNDPAAAAAWVNSLPAGDPALAKASAAITREWTRYDLAASSAWLNSLPASPELDRAVAAYTSRASQEDPATAMSWAESINNGGLRTRMMQQVAGSWKDGDPDAFAAYLDSREFSAKQRKLLESAKPASSKRGQ